MALGAGFHSLSKAMYFDFSMLGILLSFLVFDFVNRSLEMQIQSNHFSRNAGSKVDAQVIELKNSGRGQKIIAEVLKLHRAQQTVVPALGKILLYAGKDVNVGVGDVLRFN